VRCVGHEPTMHKGCRSQIDTFVATARSAGIVGDVALGSHLAGVAQRLESQPSKLVVRVRFPSPAPKNVIDESQSPNPTKGSGSVVTAEGPTNHRRSQTQFVGRVTLTPRASKASIRT
jgi:hypothetical protein